MEIFIFWDILPCRPVEIIRRVGGIYRLHIQGQRVSQARNRLEADSVLNVISQKIGENLKSNFHNVGPSHFPERFTFGKSLVPFPVAVS
jgi:hypothetical protein